MPRDSSGNYTLPLGNPVVDGTIIDVNWANPTMSDIAVQLNNVLTRDGLLGPISPFPLVDGTVVNPGLTFNSQQGTGISRPVGGGMVFSVQGLQVFDLLAGSANFSVPPRWVGPPVGGTDLANKTYVDNAVAGVPLGDYLPLVGGALAGPGNLNIAGTLDAAGLVVFRSNMQLRSSPGLVSPQYQWRASDDSLRGYIGLDTETAGAATDEQRFFQQHGFKTFYTNGAERMRLDSVGNVGIGTTATNSRLNVSNGSFRTELTGQVIMALNEARTASAELQSVGNILTYWTGAQGSQAERMRIDAAGNVGLGATPSAWGAGQKVLQMPGGSLWSFNANNMALVANVYQDGAAEKYVASGIAASKYTQNAGFHYFAIAPAGSAGNPISFTTAMVIDSGGNVGIGDTNPATAYAKSLIVNAQTGGYALFGLRGNHGSDITGVSTFNGNPIANIGFDSDSGSNPRMIFRTGVGANLVERMRIDAGGNVGIGTSSPQAYSGFVVLSLNGGANGGVLSMQKGGVVTGNISTTGTGALSIDTQGAVDLIFSPGTNERARITAAGVFTYGGLEVGYRDVPPILTGGAIALNSTHRGKCLLHNAPGTITLPSGVLPEGSTVSILNVSGGAVTLASASLVWAGVGTVGNRTLSNFGLVTIYYQNTNTPVVTGAGVS